MYGTKLPHCWPCFTCNKLHLYLHLWIYITLLSRVAGHEHFVFQRLTQVLIPNVRHSTLVLRNNDLVKVVLTMQYESYRQAHLISCYMLWSPNSSYVFSLAKLLNVNHHTFFL